MRVLVIGGCNIDISAKPDTSLVERESNIGKITFAHGGVGRNIAHNCALLGLETEMISAVGDDVFGHDLLKGLRNAGVRTSECEVSQKYPTGAYVFVLDENKDMRVAVNDTHVAKTLTRDFLSGKNLRADLIVADANLDADTIEYICSQKGDSLLFFEPVSMVKAEKAAPYVGVFDIIKPNIYEAEALTGIKTDSEEGIFKAGKELIARGVKAVFITAAQQGVYAFSRSAAYHMSPPETDIINATGAGDAFCAGIIYSVLNKLTFKATCAFALQCAKDTMECIGTVNENINADEIIKRLKGE